MAGSNIKKKKKTFLFEMLHDGLAFFYPEMGLTVGILLQNKDKNGCSYEATKISTFTERLKPQKQDFI